MKSYQSSADPVSREHGDKTRGNWGDVAQGCMLGLQQKRRKEKQHGEKTVGSIKRVGVNPMIKSLSRLSYKTSLNQSTAGVSGLP